MMEVDAKKQSRLGSDFTADQVGGEGRGPVVVGENEDVRGI